MERYASFNNNVFDSSFDTEIDFHDVAAKNEVDDSIFDRTKRKPGFGNCRRAEEIMIIMEINNHVPIVSTIQGKKMEVDILSKIEISHL